MTSWAVSSSDYGENLLIDTSAGERMVSLDPYERGGYLAPLDIVRDVQLRDLVRVLRSERAADQLMVSRQSERWFDLDTADPAFTLRPGEPRRFELEFIFDQVGGIANDDDDEGESRRLGSLLAPLAEAQRARVVSVGLHPNAYEPPWPYIVTLSLPLGGWTVEGAGRLVDSAIDLLRAVGAGELNRNVALQVLRANRPDALLGSMKASTWT